MANLDPWNALPYSNIAHACFLIAIDNGGINRTRPVARWQADYKRFIAKASVPLPEIDGWLAALSQSQLEAAASGAEEGARALLRGAPLFADALLNDYFDEVC